MKSLALVLAAPDRAAAVPAVAGEGKLAARSRELDRQVAAQRATNAQLKARNDALDAEVRDLKQGIEAIEERARMELGMIKKDEIFYQVVPGPAAR